MIQYRTEGAKGFSLVELLAVVLVLSVLAATAVPMYINTRKVAAARACKGNIAAIATAESAMVLRYGSYTNINPGLLAGPESLGNEPKCPLDGQSYTVKVTSTGTAVTQYDTVAGTGGTTLAITIGCPNATVANPLHQTAQGFSATTNSNWNVGMPALVPDSLP